jgi:hypothetical protein
VVIKSSTFQDTTPCRTKDTPWLLVCKRTIPTERPPLFGEVSANVAWSAQWILTAVNLGFIDRSRYFSIQVAPQLSSRGWMDPVPDPLLLRKSGNAWNRTQDLCSQELWPLDHRGDPITPCSPLKMKLLFGRTFLIFSLLVNSFMLVSCLAYTSTLSMEARFSCEKFVEFERTTWEYIPENRSLQFLVFCVFESEQYALLSFERLLLKYDFIYSMV